MGFVYWTRFFCSFLIYCPRVCFSIPILKNLNKKATGWKFRGAGRDEIVYTCMLTNRFCCSRLEQIFSALYCLFQMQFIVATWNIFIFWITYCNPQSHIHADFFKFQNRERCIMSRISFLNFVLKDKFHYCFLQCPNKNIR